MADEAVEDFRSSLADLTFNSKPLINMLTMLAEENVLYAEHIVKVIEDHIQKAATSHKLPALYLIDSIIKNISTSNYLSLFTRNIVSTFIYVFDKVDEKTRQAMFKLRQTWSDLFPIQKLHMLDVRVNKIDPAWPIVALQKPSTSIHVNPKFLMKPPPDADPPSIAGQQGPTKEKHLPASAQAKKVKSKDPVITNEDDTEEALRRDLMSKQQELLRLEQQKIELQIAEARASLEKLAAQQASQQVHVAPITFQPTQTVTLRDPRVKLDEPLPTAGSTGQQSASFNPTQTRPSFSAALGDGLLLPRSEPMAILSMATDGVPVNALDAGSFQMSTDLLMTNLAKASLPSQQITTSAVVSNTNTAGNIFDRMLDLVPTTSTRSELPSMPATANIGRAPAEMLTAASKDNFVSTNELVAVVQRLPTPPSEDVKTHPVPSVGDALRIMVSPERKSDEGRSSPHRTVAGKRRTAGNDRKASDATNKKEGSGPAAKKAKHGKEGDAVKVKEPLLASSLPSDLKELFGEQDQDYRDIRHLPPIPKLDQRPTLMDISHSSDLSSHSSSWANFKADHPDEFPSRLSSQLRRPSISDLNARKKAPVAHSIKQALLPTPNSVVVDGPKALVIGNAQLPIDENTSADMWPEETPVYNHSNLHPAVRRPLIMESNSRSPMRLDQEDDRSIRYDSHSVPMSVKGRLIDDMPAKDRFSNTASVNYDNPEELMPAGNHHLMQPNNWQNVPLGHSLLELWDIPIKPLFDENRFYVPEYDVRWCVRAQVGDRSTEMYTVNINNRPFEMAVNSKRRIQCFSLNLEVVLDSRLRQLMLDGIGSYRFGCPVKDVNHKGKALKVFVQGPEKKLWIDDHLFEINVDSPPERIIIGGKEHKIAIDGAARRIIVDGFDICPFGTDEEQMVQLAYVLHKISFKPPQKQILIDNNLHLVDLSGKFPVIWINDTPHGIRFDGEAREIFIDDKPWLVPMSEARKCRIDGPKPRLLAFGGPGHEVIIDDQWFEVKFGGEAKIVKFGGRSHKIQLRGKPPEVKILPEVISARDLAQLMDQPGLYERPMVNIQDMRSTSDRKLPPPPVPMSALLDLPERPVRGLPSNLSQRDPRFAQSSLLEPFSVNDNVRRQPLIDSGSLPRNASANSLSGVINRSNQLVAAGGDTHLAFDRQFSSQPNNGPDEDSRFFQNSRLLAPGNGRADNNDSRSSQFQAVDRPFQSIGMPSSTLGSQNFPVGLSIDAKPMPSSVPSFGMSGNGPHSSNVGQSPQTPVGGMVDVNLLLSQLMAKGLITATGTTAATPATSVSTGQTSNPDASIKNTAVTRSPQEVQSQSNASTMKGPVSEEQKEIARKEEELMENVPSIVDFQLENLRKRHAGAIQQMYVGISCSSCGLRFKSDTVDQYQEHLDWHFRQNRQEKEGVKVAKFRQWFYEVVDWVQFEEVADIEEKALSAFFESGPSVSSSAATLPESLTKLPDVIVCPEASENEKGDICEMCRETFEQFWNEDREAWHLKDAISVKGKIYHPVCFEDSAKECRQSDTSAIFADQSMTDLNGTAEDDFSQVESAFVIEVKPITSSTSIDEPQSQVACCDDDVKPSVVDESTDVLKPADVVVPDSVSSSRLDWRSNSINYTRENDVIENLFDDCATDINRVVVVAGESVGVEAEKSFDGDLDVVIKRETGVIDNCCETVVSDVNVKMETDSCALEQDCVLALVQVKTEIDTNSFGRETERSELVTGINTVEES